MYLKKQILALLLLASFLSAGMDAFCQFGFKAGIGVSDIIFRTYGQSPYLGYQVNSLTHNLPKISNQLGLTWSTGPFGRFSPVAEIDLAWEGINYTTSFLYDDVGYKVNIAYLKLPLLVKIDTNLKKEKQSGILAGPYISSKLRARELIVIQGVAERNEIENVKFLDAGFILGYSFDLGNTPGHLLFDTRISYSLVNMMKPIEGSIPSYTGPEDDYARMATIMLSIEYRL